MYFVYVLRSKRNNKRYIGYTSKDVQKRLKEHNFGDSKYTKGHRPYRLTYKEEFADRLSARSREKYLKSGIGREFIKRLIPP